MLVSDAKACSQAHALQRQIGVDEQEHNFRAGLVTGLTWATKVAGQMAREGKPPPEIVDRLYELLDVALDYEEGQIEMPAGKPWEWRRNELEHYICWRKSEWPEGQADA